MKIGLLLHPDRGIDSLFDEARQADRQGYDSVWLGDHLMESFKESDKPSHPFESLTLMAALAATTERTRLAWGMLNVSFRRPAVLAKSLATLDQISRGRVICSLGSGSYPREYEAYGIPLLDHDDRVAYLHDVVRLLKKLWTKPAPEETSFETESFQIKNLPFNPAPFQRPHPPIWLGGESPATMKVICEEADGWVTRTRSPGSVSKPDFVDTSIRIGEARNAPTWPTRPMTIVLQVKIFVDETREAAVSQAREALGSDYLALQDTLNQDIVGNVDDCVARLIELSGAGVNYLRADFATPALQGKCARLLLPELSRVG